MPAPASRLDHCQLWPTASNLRNDCQRRYSRDDLAGGIGGRLRHGNDRNLRSTSAAVRRGNGGSRQPKIARVNAMLAQGRGSAFGTF
jgi:hypothetical protein